MQCGKKIMILNPAVQSNIDELNSQIAKKKKKTKLLFIILAAVVLLFSIGGYFTYTSIQAANKAKAIDAYILTATTFAADILESGSKLEKTGNTMQTFWNSHIWENGIFKYEGEYFFTSSITNAVIQAQEKRSAELNYAKSSKSRIDSLYNQLMTLPEGTDAELSEIKSAARSLYDAYTEFYSCIIDPTGNYSSWTSQFSSHDSNVSSKLNTFKNLLKTYE